MVCHRKRAGLILHVFYAGDIRINDQRIVRIIHNESRLCTIWFLDMLLLHIINFHLVTAAVLRIISCKPSCLLEGAIRQLAAAGLHDYMGAGRAFRVKPPVIPVGKGEGQLRMYPLCINSSLICARSASFMAMSRALLMDSRYWISSAVS